MDVLLFTDVPYFGFSRYAGAYKVASELRKAGFTVQVVDFFLRLERFEINKILDQFIDERTLFVGISSTFLRSIEYSKRSENSDPWIHELRTLIQQRSVKTKLVLGGSRTHDRTPYSYGPFDFRISGNSEIAAVALARHLRNGSPIRAERNSAGEHTIDAASLYPDNDFHHSTIEWHENDGIFRHESLPLEVARGCVFRCSFCAFPFNGKRPGDYIKSNEALDRELRRNRELFGINKFYIVDDTFNDSVEKVERMHRLFTSLPFPVELTAYIRLDLLGRYPHTIDLLEEMGLKSAFFGIETLNAEAGRRAGKNANPEKTIATLEKVAAKWQGKVLTQGGFVIGLPGETEESARQTHRWFMEPGNPLDGAAFQPLHIETNPNYPFRSKIDRDPAAHGFNLNLETGHWQNATMTSTLAQGLAREFAQTDRTRNVFGGFAYPLLRNLEVASDECHTMTNAKIEQEKPNLREIGKKLKTIYLNRILS